MAAERDAHGHRMVIRTSSHGPTAFRFLCPLRAWRLNSSHPHSGQLRTYVTWLAFLLGRLLVNVPRYAFSCSDSPAPSWRRRDRCAAYGSLCHMIDRSQLGGPPPPLASGQRLNLSNSFSATGMDIECAVLLEDAAGLFRLPVGTDGDDDLASLELAFVVFGFIFGDPEPYKGPE